MFPGVRGRLEGQDLELHFDLAGRCMVGELAIRRGLLFPWHEEGRVSKDGQITAAHGARLDHSLRAGRLSQLHEPPVWAHRLQR